MATPRQWRRRRRFSLFALTVVGALVVAAVAFGGLSADPYYAPAGTTVQITGDGMAAGESVTVDVTYPDASLAQHHVVVADTNGDFADTYTVQETDPSGIYTVTATGQSSGTVFTTTFDPPNFGATFTASGISPTSVNYSDVVTFSGTFTCTNQGSSSGNKCNSTDTFTPTVTIQLKGGVFGDWTDVTSKTVAAFSFPADATTGCPTACSVNWSFTWQAGKYDSTSIPPDTYDVRAVITNLGGTINQPASGISDGLAITKENTTTTYTGPSSGQTNSTVSVSATVADEDSSLFANDSVFAGTVTWNLMDGATLLASTSDSSLTWNAGTKKWDASASLDLTGVTPGNYTIDTVFTPSSSSPDTSTYYNGSSDSDPFEVTPLASSYVSEGFYAPVDSVNKAKAGQTIPLKWNLWLDPETLANEIIDPTLGTGHYALDSVKTSCALAGSNDDPPVAGDAGASGLRYSYFDTPTTTAYGQNIYAWQTNKGWANTCRTFTVTYDGFTVASALFQFTK